MFLHIFVVVLDLYADTPPLETLMEVPLHVRRTQLFKVNLKDNEADVLNVSPSLVQMALDIFPGGEGGTAIYGPYRYVLL